MDDFCKQLPKIELHAHLNGSLSKNTLKALGCLDESIEEFQKLKNFSKDELTLQECFLLFKIAQNATSTQKSLYIATRNVIEEFLDDNVIYLELRTTPKQTAEMNYEQYIETVIEAITSFNEGIITKLLLSIDRRIEFEEASVILEIILKMKLKYPDIIKGIELSGDPQVGKFYEELFDKARKANLYISLHCAEIKNDNEVEIMLKFKPDRIGHCTCLHPLHQGNEANWKLYKSLKIPAEFCLTSNVICQTVKSYSEHHIKEWMEEKLPFCLNTDDKGVFNTSLSEEFLIYSETFNISKKELTDLIEKAIKYSFASDAEKAILREKIETFRNLHHLNS